MLDRQWMQDREDRRDEKVEERHKEQMKTLKGQFWWQIGILGVAIIIATVVAAMIEAQWITKPW